MLMVYCLWADHYLRHPMTETQLVQVGDLSVKLNIHRERRRYSRVSLTQDGISLRIPSHGSDVAGDPVVWAMKWIKSQYHKNPSVFERYRQRQYESGMVYETPYGTFGLQVHETVGSKIVGKLKENTLLLELPPTDFQWLPVSKLIAKLIVRRLRPDFVHDVHLLNEKYFGFAFQNIRLKYNTSNWGSCSNKRNLNFNSRLFLAPREIMHYVIIHELAHLQQMNHSKRFWNLVASADKDFHQHRQWLKEHGPALIF